jgi:cytochrome c biogenesis protein CcdA
MKLAFGITIPVMTIGWFSLLSFLFTHPSFLPHLQRYQRRFSIAMGALLILLALSVVGKVILARFF